MPSHDDVRGSTSTRILQHIIRDLTGPMLPKSGAIAGLPADTIAVTPARLIVAVTPLSGSHFAAQAVDACARTGFDVVVVSSGLHPEVLDPVTVSAVTFELTGAHAVMDMTFCRSTDGRLLLAPSTGDWAYVLTTTGLRRIDWAFADVDERAEAACRWAREIVFLVRGRR